MGRIKSETDPTDLPGHETQYTYSHNATGNLVSIRDAMLKTTSYHYDELDRLYWVDYPEPGEGVDEAADVEYEYDALGRRTKMTDGVGETTWVYNNLDLPETISAPLSPSVSYDYDWRGNRASVSYDNYNVTYKYDVLNRLYEVVGGGLPDKVGYEYDAAGRLTNVTRPNNVNTVYDYYDNGWLRDITHSAGTEILASYQYQYDHAGNRTQAIENILHPAPSLQSNELVSSVSQEEIAPSAPATASPVDVPAPTQPTPPETPSSFTYTSQPDGGTGDDTYLLSKSANKNYGDEMELEVGESSAAQDEVARGLIRFDLSSIPANAVVTSAWLSLWPAVDSAENDRTIRAYRLKTGFEEAGATWQEAAAGVRWEAEGASGVDDRESVAIGSAPILGSEPVGVEKKIMLSTSKVEEWIDGTFANHGLLVVVETELDDRFSYEFL